MAPSNTQFLQLLFMAIFVLLANSDPSLPQQPYRHIPLDGAIGPESILFDNFGDGPYTGTSDGRVMKWNRATQKWDEFATQPQRDGVLCDGSRDPDFEAECGRPLGLQLNRVTGEFYIVDAYHGLLVVGPRGGMATPVVTSAEGRPFIFLDGVDVDQATGMVYFTEASGVYTRKDHELVSANGDRTGRIISYNPWTREVRVLLGNLPFPNGVALSRDGSFLLVSETSALRVMRYWLRGPRSGDYEVFAFVPGFPDNIKMNSRGEFWVAVAHGLVSDPDAGTVVGVKLNEDGAVLQVLVDKQIEGTVSVSEVQESNGAIWIGSVDQPFVGIYINF
ncbi:hypothetical protein H6P81_010896 [Aristolochia fimbriata]|uniref:Strictosidine synthase conserved region domain-containing protein n=1 Tax=Aristolochia fimbriata TaxID=158543 RepID=A0AAV7ETI6_ARIFI|nr:hypothetical protein H6P81_010896 [Aristolochia fimbriata]